MDNIINVAFFILCWVFYGFLAHRIAKRGEHTGLNYRWALFLAISNPPIAAVWFYWVRTLRGNWYVEWPADRKDN